MFDSEDYHSHFKVMESERHEILTDKFAIHFFKLKKLGKHRKNKRIEDWLNLVNAETEGKLMAIQKNTSIPEEQQTIVTLRKLNADEKERQVAFYREKRLHDEASALSGARREGFIIGYVEAFVKAHIKFHSSNIQESLRIAFNTLPDILENRGYTESQIKSLLEPISKMYLLAELVKTGLITTEQAAVEADCSLYDFKRITE